MQNQANKLNNLLDVQRRFPTEQICRDYLEQMRWQGIITCPRCQSGRTNKFKDGKLYFCSECRKQFTVKIGTIFEDSAIALQKWFFAIFIATAHKKGVSSCQLARDISVTQKTAWFMLGRIRYAMQTKTLLKPLNGTIEIDETYVGGKSKFKHASKKAKLQQGTGYVNKTPLFGMLEREGEVRTEVVEQADGATLKPIIRKNVTKESVLMTDEFGAYKDLKVEFAGHEVVSHSVKEYSRGNAHTNGIENFWSMFKRGVVGIYHQISPEHLHRYGTEFEFRYNTRKIGDTERFALALNQCEGKLSYKQLINHEEK